MHAYMYVAIICIVTIGNYMTSVYHQTVNLSIAQTLTNINSYLYPYAPINVMPHYPPPGHNRGQYRGIDVETQAPYRGI